MVTVTGKLIGIPVSVTWEDGKLLDDSDILVTTGIRDAIRRGKEMYLNPSWPTVTASIADPVSFAVTAGAVMDYVNTITGDWPADPLPEGAIT